MLNIETILDLDEMKFSFRWQPAAKIKLNNLLKINKDF